MRTPAGPRAAPRPRPRAAAAAGPGAPPLSVAQEALWDLSLLVPNQVSYNETISIRKDGPFDLPAFRRAFSEIIRRHGAWRTTFDAVAGKPVQVLQPAPSFDLALLDLSHLTPDQAERRAVHVVAEASRVPYDVRRGPLLRPRLIRFPGDRHRLYLALHHLIFDAVSVTRIVLPELITLYDAFCADRPCPLPDPEAEYADYARWEQEWIAEPEVRQRLEHWRQHLDPLPVLSLPFDRPRPPERRYRGGVVTLSVPGEAVDGLREVGLSVGATLFQVLAATWALLLGRYSGQDDVVFAAATDLRQRPEFESVVGYFVTPLPLRIDLSGEPRFADLVVRVRNELLDGLDQLVPFERVVRELQPDGASNANPIYQTMLVMEPPVVALDASWSVHLMESEIGDAVGGARLDLELQLDEQPDGRIAGRLIYDRDLFDAATAKRITDQWLHLTLGAAADPSSIASTIPIVTPGEAQGQLVEWNATATSGRSGAVDDLVRARSAERPGARAVSAGGLSISYEGLDRRAGRLAHRLLAADVRPGDVVALCSEPSIDLVVGVLGVLKAGAAYLLLDPGMPTEQLQFMLTDSGAAAVLAPTALAVRAVAPFARALDLVVDPDDREPAAPTPVVDIAPEAACCVQYRSAPGEEPMGVALRHASAVNLANALAGDLGIGPTSTVLVIPGSLFSLAGMELWPALTAGARIVIAPADVAMDGARLSRLIAKERVTFLHATPSTWRRLIDTGLKSSRSLRALSAGEPLSSELAGQILKRFRVLWNSYGTAETTACATLARIAASAPITIGRPIANTRAYVLDRHDQPVAVGVSGKLLVAGDGVASGYLNRSDLDTEAFVDDPFGPGRAYRTGDMARWRPDGELEIVVARRRRGATTPAPGG